MGNMEIDEEELDFSDTVIDIPPLPDYYHVGGGDCSQSNNDVDCNVDRNVDSNVHSNVDSNVHSNADSNVDVGYHDVVDDIDVVVHDVVDDNDSYVDTVDQTNDDEFINSKIHSIVKHGGLFKFSGKLTVAQRQYIHQIAEKYNLFHQSSGTRYRCITVSKEPIVMPLSIKSKPRLELQAAATYKISSSENVIEVIKDQPKRRGRPP
jgi:hypothetical protein